MIHFDQDRLIKRINEIQSLMMQENFWDDNRLAKSLIDEQNHSRDLLDTYKDVKTKIENLDDSINLLKDEYDKELHELLSEEFVETIKDVEKFEIKVLLNDPLDAKNAILEFHPGAGGTKSQDWASMLYRMYVRYAQRNNFNVEIVDYQSGDEAGIKSVTMIVKGPNAYGYLKNEKGVHRLVRISPFDASKEDIHHLHQLMLFLKSKMILTLK